MAGIFATAGSKLFIGGVLTPKITDWVQSDFSAQSWLEVGWLENLGAFGDEAAAVNFDAIGAGRTQKLKGNRNAGDMTVVCAIDYSDVGQIAIKAASATDFSYGFRVQFDDAPPGGQPSQRYFIALVMASRETLDTANTVMKMNSTLAINGNVVRVNAA